MQINHSLTRFLSNLLFFFLNNTLLIYELQKGYLLKKKKVQEHVETLWYYRFIFLTNSIDAPCAAE